MNEDEKIKNKINELMSPELSFEEFCSRNDIRQDDAAMRSRKSRRAIMPVAATAAAVVLCGLGVGIPLTIKSINESGKRYQTDYNYGVQITYDELMSDENIVMFDMKHAISITYFSTIYEKRGGEFYGYCANVEAYGTQMDGVEYWYRFELNVKCNDEYELPFVNRFVQYTRECNGLQINYSISNPRAAMIWFDNGGYEYYISLTPFSDYIEINKQTVDVFIDMAYDGADYPPPSFSML